MIEYIKYPEYKFTHLLLKSINNNRIRNELIKIKYNDTIYRGGGMVRRTSIAASFFCSLLTRSAAAARVCSRGGRVAGAPRRTRSLSVDGQVSR